MKILLNFLSYELSINQFSWPFVAISSLSLLFKGTPSTSVLCEPLLLLLFLMLHEHINQITSKMGHTIFKFWRYWALKTQHAV